MNRIQEQDILRFSHTFALSERLENSTFLITGATGLIGSALIHCLLSLNRDITIIAPVRNFAKTESMFDMTERQNIRIIECDITKYDYSQITNVDYIIHCAAPTASKFFVEHPVETFDTIYNSSQKLLEYASQCRVKSFVYLSSLEVYGEIHNDSAPITEDIQGYLNPMNIRSSYPMAKRAVETLCALYVEQYKIPVKVARLTQTTGAGIEREDDRVMAQFARLVSRGQDIILHTAGDAARPYCYITDAVSAVLYILLLGNDGEAYNVANETTYISVRGLADYLQHHFNPSIKVKIEINENMGYAPVTKQKLSTKKLRDLGWIPQYKLQDILERLIKYLSDNER